MKESIHLSDLRSVMFRVRSAPEDSPLLVYSSTYDNLFRVAFGSTIVSLEDVKRGRDRNGCRVIGLFNKAMPASVVRSTLLHANERWLM